MRYPTNSASRSNTTNDLESHYSDAQVEISLLQILPTARFFAGDDIRFQTVASKSGNANSGELVVYRIGENCPEKVISDAMARGAAGILTEQLLPSPLPQCIVGDIDMAMARIVSETNGRPDRKMLTVGVVGSAGKTTTALLLSKLLRSVGVRTAYQTDLGDCDGIVQNTSKQSTPSGTELVQWMCDACDVQSNAVILELTQEDLRRGCYDAIEFDLMVVTGSQPDASLSDEELDFGPSSLQCALERLGPRGVVVAPADQPKAMRVIRDSGAAMVTYGVRHAADLSAKIIDQSGGMSTLLISYHDTTAVMETPLCGASMAANHAAAVMTGLLMNMELPAIAETLSGLREIPGRGQKMASVQYANTIIDVGGTPERSAGALRAARSMKASGQFWCVLAIDCDDDPTQLALYGNLLERFANNTVLSCHGDSAGFLKASHCVLDGVKNCAAMRLVANHERAVRWAVSQAKPNDTILVLGGVKTETAYEQRKKIETISKWIDSERELTGEKAPAQDTDFPQTPKLSIFK